MPRLPTSLPSSVFTPVSSVASSTLHSLPQRSTPLPLLSSPINPHHFNIVSPLVPSLSCHFSPAKSSLAYSKHTQSSFHIRLQAPLPSLVAHSFSSLAYSVSASSSTLFLSLVCTFPVSSVHPLNPFISHWSVHDWQRPQHRRWPGTQ